MALRTISLCTGIGGLELGLVAWARTVCYVERDAYAAACLVARMESSDLDQAPIWSDLVSFDGVPWRGCVDVLTAGFPCQPHSVAGQRKGLGDERWIWPDIVRIIREVGPGIVLLENVPGLASSGGLAAVLGDLAALGFDAEWGVFRASDVGAPHVRARLFILAWDVSHPERDTLRQLAERGEGGTQAEQWDTEPGELGEQLGAVADADGRRQQGERGPQPVERQGGQSDAHRHEPDGRDGTRPAVEHAAGEGRQGEAWGEARRSVSWPPGPGGVAQGQWDGPQPAVCRDADGTAYRLDRLRCLGNAVVPAQAALAWRELWRRSL